MASLGLWTLPFCSRAGISPPLCSIASLPIEPTPQLFFGWHLNGVAIPPPAPTTTTVRRQAPPVGRGARGTWTTTLDSVQKTLNVGATLRAIQDGLNEYVRDKRPGVLVPHSAGCNATPQRSRSKSLNSQTCFLRATPSCSKLTSTAPRAASESLGTATVLSFFGDFGQPGIFPQGMHAGVKTLYK